MTRAGTPKTVAPLGTSLTTTEFALTTTLSPIVTAPTTLQPAPKYTVVADRCAADPADIHDTGTLVESATMADLFRQDENAGEVMDDKTGPNLVFARDMDSRDRHAEDVNEQDKG